MKSKRILIFTSLVFAILAIGFIILNSNKPYYFYSGIGVSIPSEYTVFGIDISHHQGEIDYKVATGLQGNKDSVEFVYVKATEGTNFIDRKFADNAEGFAKFKMKYGFYHFYQPDKSASKQARFYCETIKNYNFKLIPVVDIEVIGNRTKKQLSDSLMLFLGEVERILEVRPMLYTYVSFYKDYLSKSPLNKELLWLASYNQTNPYMEMDNAIIWQFSEKGNINGFGTKVDLNVAKRSFFDLVVRKR